MASVPSNERISFRTNIEVKSMIERAASLLGQSVTDFAIAALVNNSKQVIKEHESIRLMGRDREAFFLALQDDSGPNEFMKRAKQAHKTLIVQ